MTDLTFLFLIFMLGWQIEQWCARDERRAARIAAGVPTGEDRAWLAEARASSDRSCQRALHPFWSPRKDAIFFIVLVVAFVAFAVWEWATMPEPRGPVGYVLLFVGLFALLLIPQVKRAIHGPENYLSPRDQDALRALLGRA